MMRSPLLSASRPAEAQGPSGGGARPEQNAAPVRGGLAIATEAAALAALLKLEGDLRDAASREELILLAANEFRRFTQARQVYVFVVDGGFRFAAPGALRLAAVSGLPVVDRTTPFAQELEQVVGRVARTGRLDVSGEFALGDIADASHRSLAVHPHRVLLWLPLRPVGCPPVGGLLLAADETFEPAARATATRLASALAHAMALHEARPRIAARLAARARGHGRTILLGSAAAIAALAFPVSMTALSPMEITPRDPHVVAAAIEGVIEDVPVEPNASVEAGQILVRFTDTVLRNRAEIAEREVLVADAKVKRATQLAFDDARGRQEVGIALAEHELKKAERKLAAEMLERAVIKAPHAAIALMGDRRALMGKPVAAGERIMLLADPAKVELTIDVSVADAMLLRPGARVKAFLDSDPLRPREAVVERADYEARPRASGQLSYRVTARFTGNEAPPRLGVRGTAELFGDTVPAGYYLFRRPLSALRQWTGL